MKLADDPCVVNGIEIMELSIAPRLAGAPYVLMAKYALVVANPKTNKIIATHGQCSAYQTNWTTRTQKILQDLIDSMEEDLLPKHFNVPVTKDTKQDTSEEDTYESRTTAGPEEVDQV